MATTKKVATDVNGDLGATIIDRSESPFFSEPTVEKPPLPKSNRDTELILKALEKSYVGMGLMVSIFSPPDGILIVGESENLAESWRSLLDNDPKVRRILKKSIEASGWGAVVAAHAAVAVPIIQNHRDQFNHLIKRRETAPTG